MVFKAQMFVYDQQNGKYKLAGTIMINMDNVVVMSSNTMIKEGQFGYNLSGKKLWNVETSIHNTGYHLLVVSDYLDRLEKDSL